VGYHWLEEKGAKGEHPPLSPPLIHYIWKESKGSQVVSVAKMQQEHHAQARCDFDENEVLHLTLIGESST